MDDKILLGCGDERRDGWILHDRVAHSDHVSAAHDLNVTPWPFAGGSAERIEALDVLEHLDHVVAFMDECWRILQPGGRLLLRVVRYTSENLWRDPTHQRGFHPDTFSYFDPSSAWWKQYGRLYTLRAWRIISLVDGDNIVVEMEPIK